MLNSMKRVLLVSPYPYTQTNRGMDIMTLAFEQSGWETHHLVFPNVFYTVKKKAQFPTSVIEHKAGKTHIPYVDSVMKKLPSFIFRWLVQRHQAKVRNIEWEKFDAVVLESGKPLFLLDLIREKTRLIYRQSDSVRIFLGKNPDYVQLEEDTIEASNHTLVVKERFKHEIEKKHHEKITVIRNGFSVPKNYSIQSPYRKNTKNAVYIGIAPLDEKGLKIICKSSPDVDFHIFGTGLRRFSGFHGQPANLYNHGYANASEYLPYLSHADIYILPFKRTERMVDSVDSEVNKAVPKETYIQCAEVHPVRFVSASLK